MLYDTLVESYERLESTTKRLEMTDILADLLYRSEPDEIDEVIYLTQGKIHPDWTGEPEIGMAEKTVIETILKATGLSKDEVEALTAETGDIGLAAEEALKRKKIRNLSSKNLTVNDVYTSLDKISKESGKGSTKRKIDRLVKLLVNASPLGARYIARMVVGTLRLGVGDMTILDALSLGYTGGKDHRELIERSYNLSSDLGDVAKSLASEGIDSLRNYCIVVGKPIRMMSAQRLSTPEEVIEKLEGLCSAEFKLDGERFQIHKRGDKVQIFSRRLENITSMYPDAVELTRKNVTAEEAILEGEAVAMDTETGEMQPFQTLMQRRRKYKVMEMAKKLPISIILFDCLYSEGEDLTQMPYPVRKEELRKIVDVDERFH
ncbi:MAG: ATP-dependent DNA ligase, partial [Candidatus Methylarchaceae archaeon HK01M]|nr:ATP-dependent DNA ligase [Candidatus Methylarchaceae archaeon HK01M]